MDINIDDMLDDLIDVSVVVNSVSNVYKREIDGIYKRVRKTHSNEDEDDDERK